jgi:hypothetical protein
MNITHFGAELFNSDRRMERHDEADSRFSPFFESAHKGLILTVRLMPLLSLQFIIKLNKFQ